MKLYIKQRVFSFIDSYDVYDENANPIFRVKSEFLSFPKQIRVFDLCNNELFRIQKNFTLFLSSYCIYQNDILYADIQQQFKLFSGKVTVESSYGHFEIDGSIFDYDYTIKMDTRILGTVHKVWFSLGDSYELYVDDNTDAAFFTSLVVAIDNCFHDGNKR